MINDIQDELVITESNLVFPHGNPYDERALMERSKLSEERTEAFKSLKKKIQEL